MKRAAIILALMLSACVASGVKVTQEQVDQFKKGQSTRSDVVKALGQPTMSSATAEGNQSLVYGYLQVTARPETFIPFVGPLVGGADSRGTNVVFRFDRMRILIDWYSSQTNIGTGTGFSSGVSPARVDGQPSQ